MRCQCCNKSLSDYESTARHAETNEFLDTCNQCLKDTGIPILGRKDLDQLEEVEDDFENTVPGEWEE